MATTKIRGNTQIMDYTVDLGRLVQNFLGGANWDITNGAANATITGLASPLNATDAATKAYADNIAAGFGPKRSVRYATTGELTATYNNGTAGVGATLTNNGTQEALHIDDATNPVVIGQRILVKNQSAELQNGIYVVTVVGTGSTNWVLTRATDFDNSPDGEIRPGDFVPVEAGDTLSGYQFYQVDFTTGDAVGTDPITFSPFSNPITIGDDYIKDNMIDWGTGANQVSAADMPIADAGNYFSATDVEGALQELGAKVPGTEVIGELPTLNTTAETATLAHTNVVAGSERVYLNGVRQIRGASYDYTIVDATGVITFTSPGLSTNDVVTVDYRYTV